MTAPTTSLEERLPPCPLQLEGERLAHLTVTNMHGVHWSHAGLQSNWLRVVSYRLDHGHCEASGFQALARGIGHDTDAWSCQDEQSDGSLERCYSRVDMWRRPFVTRHGMAQLCSDYELRQLLHTFDWALRPAAEARTKKATASEIVSWRFPRLRVCDQLSPKRNGGRNATSLLSAAEGAIMQSLQQASQWVLDGLPAARCWYTRRFRIVRC